MITRAAGMKRAARLMREIADVRGLRAKIARRLKLSSRSVDCWVVVPLAHVFIVARIVRLPAEELRPDFFRLDPVRMGRSTRNRPTYRLRESVDLSPEAEAARLADARHLVDGFFARSKVDA